MSHIKPLGNVRFPAGARTLLEWTQKGVIVNSFVDALATLAGIKEPAS